MKLVFPNGEHRHVLLRAGVNRIGSTPGSTVVLRGDDIRALHCEIHFSGTRANLQVPRHGGPVTVNDRPVSDIMALRSGDRIGIGSVVAMFAPIEAMPQAPAPVGMQAADDDIDATRVRVALPRFVLRGVSGAVAGKLYPVAGPVVIGRTSACDITVPSDEISRRHARLKPVGDGLAVEDLESSNGTYINDARVQQGFLNPGDALRLDTVRFVLITADVAQSPQTHGPHADGAPPRAAFRKWRAVLVGGLALLTVAAFLLVAGTG
ncbi:MAG: FHA domain-containing protein [Luteimonas sp.]